MYCCLEEECCRLFDKQRVARANSAQRELMLCAFASRRQDEVFIQALHQSVPPSVALPGPQPMVACCTATVGAAPSKCSDALPGVGWCEVRVLFDAGSCIKTSLLHLLPYFESISSSPEWEVSSSRCQRGRRQLPSRFPPRMARQAL